jgi:hypothetical protein
MPSPGIGAAGILGIAREVLAPPVQSALATATTGGTITAGTYKYVVTAINANGETTISNEQTIVTTGATSTVTVTWASVTGATGYKLYKTAAGGATGTELLYKTVGVVLTDTDTTPGTPTGAFPTLNSASNSGVYAPPTKFIPFMSESLTSTQSTIWRRPIRQSADIIGAVPGNFNVAGDISIEGMEDCVVYFLFGSRMSIAKTGASPNFIYTCTPTANAIPNNTLSITVVRNGIVFGFTGCVVTSQTFTQNDGIFMYNMSIIGRDEAVQSLPTATWPTTVPFGAGQWSIEIPTATPVFDTDTFEFTIDDGADPQFRLKNTTRGADFIKYGERALTMTMERDFLDRTDFDAFKALTSQTITITASKGVNNSISMNAPAAIKDTYEVTNSGQGDLVRASLAYNGVIDGTGKSYQITLKTQENVL